MDRGIKFRAWQNGMVFQEKCGTEGLLKFFKQLYEDCILMQYTGLKDSSGKEIYEGDLLKFLAFHNTPDEWRRGQVIYETHGFFISDLEEPFYRCHLGSPSSLEIIGNIFEIQN